MSEFWLPDRSWTVLLQAASTSRYFEEIVTLSVAEEIGLAFSLLSDQSETYCFLSEREPPALIGDLAYPPRAGRDQGNLGGAVERVHGGYAPVGAPCLDSASWLAVGWDGGGIN